MTTYKFDEYDDNGQNRNYLEKEFALMISKDESDINMVNIWFTNYTINDASECKYGW